MANNTYTAAGANTWTCPANVTTANIEVWAGGGGGSNRGANGVGGGGGGGAYAKLTDFAVSANQVYNLVVGAAGSTSGGAGGNSSFNNAANTIVCQAEGGGGPGSANATGAAGGAVANSTGNTLYAGGAGASGVASTYGGGGGGSGGTGANGDPGSTYNGAAAVTGGGPGGNGRNTANGVGVAPASGPGGGGGGCWKNSTTARLGGAGYRGQVIITYVASNNIAANDTVHATLADVVTVVVSKPIVLSASNNIAAGGNNNTTAQLTAPANKTSGNNFVAGKISDDTNPLPSIDISANNYTEIEFCIKADSTKGAANNQVYNLRLTANGTAFNNYTANATWTIGVGGGATQINANNTVHTTLADAGVLLQTHLIAANDTVHTAPTDAAVVLQTHLIVTADTVHATLADQTTAIATSVIAAADGTHATLADGATLLQTHLIVSADCVHATLADQTTTIATSVIVPADGTHATLSDAVTLLQTHIVASADCVHTQPCDEATISVTGSVTITAADCVHAQPCDEAGVLQTHLLAAVNTVHLTLNNTDDIILLNTDFENVTYYDPDYYPDHWDPIIFGSGDSRATAEKTHNGAWSGRFYKGAGPGSSYLDQTLSVVPGQKYLFFFWHYGDGAHSAQLVVLDISNGGLVPGFDYGDNVADPVADWTLKTTGVLTVPANCYSIEVSIAFAPGGAGVAGPVYVDGIAMWYADPVTLQQLHILIAEEAIHLQTLDVASILQTHLISANDNAHAQLADEASLSGMITEITPGSCVHGGIVPEIIMSSKGKFLKKATSTFYVEL
jgi:hypothetical protein